MNEVLHGIGRGSTAGAVLKDEPRIGPADLEFVWCVRCAYTPYTVVAVGDNRGSCLVCALCLHTIYGGRRSLAIGGDDVIFHIWKLDMHARVRALI